MAEVLADRGQWTVSARSSGGVLAVRVGQPGLQMGFVGCPRGLDQAEIQGWLSELIGMSAAAADVRAGGTEASPSLPIPRSLHQALTGLLFLESEVWGEPADRVPMALVVMEWGDRVALGWSGSGRVTLTRSDQPAEPAWVVVRDDRGREARALVTDGETPLGVRVSWSAGDPQGEAMEGVLEAEWPGRARPRSESDPVAGVESPERTLAMPGEPELGPPIETPTEAVFEAGVEESAEPVAEVPAVAETPADTVASRPSRRLRPFWHFRGWMDRLGGFSGSDEEETADSSVAPARPSDAEAPVLDPPSSELEPIAHDVPGVPDLLPEPCATSAPEVVSDAAEMAAEPGIPVEELLEPVVPATPEPVAQGPVEPDAAVMESPMAGPVAAPVPSVAETPAAGTEVEPGIPVEELLEPLVAAMPEPVADGPVEPTREPIVESEVAAGSPADAAPAAAPRARVRRLEWPDEEPRRPWRRRWRRSWSVALVVVGLFGFGWLLGHVDAPSVGRAIGSAFKAIGLGPARYELAVVSRPAGAWIAVDGVDQARRTPATLALRPGRHEITLSLSGEGGSTHPVEGKRGERVALDVALWGGLRIDAPPGSAPLSVTVDGMPRGYAPLVMDRLPPGIHRLQFSGPGVAPWEQTVEVVGVGISIELHAASDSIRIIEKIKL